MCMLCGKKSVCKVECRAWDSTVSRPFTVYLCSVHGELYEFLLEYDRNNPDPSSYANNLLGMMHVGEVELLKDGE